MPNVTKKKKKCFSSLELIFPFMTTQQESAEEGVKYIIDTVATMSDSLVSSQVAGCLPLHHPLAPDSLTLHFFAHF